MLIVRVLAAAAKPALLSGALVAAAGTGYYAYDRYTGSGPATVFQHVQADGQQRLLISEFGAASDRIVAVNPDDVTDRADVARIDHAYGFGVFPVLSPDGSAIAYTGLPASIRKPNADSAAEAAVVDAAGDVQALADDVDLIAPPVWAPDSRSFVVRKSSTRDDGSALQELVRLSLDGSRVTLTAWSSASAYAVAFSPDGAWFYFATLNGEGTDLYRIGLDGSGEQKVARLSDGLARDWRLSPDGSTLAYTVAASPGGTAAVATQTLDIASATLSAPVDDTTGAAQPAWRADGVLTGTQTSATGVDMPQAWSPDGARLAVRAVDAATRQSRLEVVQADGSRVRVTDSADALIVGWMP